MQTELSFQLPFRNSSLRHKDVIVGTPYVRKKALNPGRKIRCTSTRRMGKSPDVQFGIWFSIWNVGSMSGKWGEISETSKRRIDICFLQEVR